MKRHVRKPGRTEILGLVTCALLLCLTLPFAGAWAQDQSVKELMGRAQSEAEKKAVEDLIKRLQPTPKATTTTTPPGAQPAKDEEPAKRETGTEADPRAPPKGPADGEQKPRETVVESPGGSAAGIGEKPAEGGSGDKSAAAEQKPDAEARPAPEKVVEQAERSQLPSVDLEVQFEYDSAILTPQAVETLTPLGHALSDARLADGAFLIAGHTDAKGSSSYNLRLSQRRAEAVRQFLIDNFKIAPERLVAKGFGEQRLKVQQTPRAAENRRVQIVNFKQREP
jgi:outer membrane protein OmpA-like peptidoglycan-associated protein